LLRVDEQVRRVHGEYAWVLRTFHSFLTSLESCGDELGWHPHFWRFDDSAKRWYQDAQDVDWQISMLKQAHHDYCEIFPGRAKSVRMGWDYHNNRTLQTLERLGVVVDFSAIPGLRTLRKTIPSHPENLFDWYPTPRYAYRPSVADCRRPAHGSEDSCQIIEAPNFVATSRVWGLISGLQFARKMRDAGQIWRAIERPTYWINITGRPRLFAPLVAELRTVLKRNDSQQIFFVTYFHPDELLPNNSSLYDLKSARTNLESLLNLCEDTGAIPEFIQARRVADLMTAPSERS
jgi:hypothetical protein